jgi:hypothetical protein
MADEKELFVERHPKGYKVLRPNAERASAIEPTQQKAIERAKEIEPTGTVHVERVRNTKKGTRDHWRT